MTFPIEVQSLHKVFIRRSGFKDMLKKQKNYIKALQNISFSINEGEIFGLLGPNGAGKTTLIKILTTLIIPTTGNVRIFGHDIRKEAYAVKDLIGLIHSDERSFFWRLSGKQNLEFFAALFHLSKKNAKSRIDELLHLVGLEKDANTEFHNYSTGMRQKLAIARGLLTHPKILFMDEALRSIDPVSTQKIRKFIKEDIYRIFKGTVVLATNRLEEATQLCNRVAVLNKGIIVASGSIQELETVFKKTIEYEIEIRNLNNGTYKKICEMKWIKKCEMKDQFYGIVTIELGLQLQDEEKLHFVLKEVIENGGYIMKCIRKQPSIEEIFADIIKTSEEYHQGE